MILTLIGIGAIVLGIIVYLLHLVIDNYTPFDVDTDWLGALGIFLAILGIFHTLVIGFTLIGCRAGVQRQIAKNQIRYEGLLKEVELLNSDYEDISKVEVVKEITKWNDYVNSAQYWSENPWTSWFYVQEVVDGLDYIEVPNLN